MKLIPLYDETVPVACTITDAEIPERIDLIERMRSKLDHIDRTDHGLVLHFAPEAEVEADLRGFTVDEKRCCEFWGFAVASSDDDLTLRWDGPPDAAPLIDALHGYFTGSEPLTAVTGLL